MKQGVDSTDRISYLTLLWTYFRIGLMTFGGGFAMATVVRHELVVKREWLSDKEFINTLSIATAVPGSIAVNLAFIEGRRLRGMLGAISAAVGTISPSVIVILIIARLGAPYFENPVVSTFLKGCAIAVAGQIGFAAYTFTRNLRGHWKNVFACALGLFLVIMGFHPVLAVMVVAGTGYLIMHERMTPREKVNELEILEVLEGVPAPPLMGDKFEKDIKDIVYKPDGGVKEQIDEVISKCPVMDVEGTMELGALFDCAAEKLSERLSVSAEHLASALKERESASSTALKEWIAVPHVVIEDEAEFEMLLVRSLEGIWFSEQAPEVKAVFVLVGSLEKRDLYMSALADIGRFAATEDSCERWLIARKPQELRDVLLSIRNRDLE